MTIESNKKIHICLGNQLFPVDILKKYKIKSVFMREDMRLCTYQRHHKHKIILFLSAMRSYRDMLIKNNIFRQPDSKLKRIVEVTGIPKEMYTSKPLVGIKEKVFETMDEFSSVECDYLIAYVPDIVWGDTLDILSEKL